MNVIKVVVVKYVSWGCNVIVYGLLYLFVIMNLGDEVVGIGIVNIYWMLNVLGKV